MLPRFGILVFNESLKPCVFAFISLAFISLAFKGFLYSTQARGTNIQHNTPEIFSPDHWFYTILKENLSQGDNISRESIK